MKTATALTVAAIGAILAFAVTAEPSFFNFHAAGWVLMLTGIARLRSSRAAATAGFAMQAGAGHRRQGAQGDRPQAATALAPSCWSLAA